MDLHDDLHSVQLLEPSGNLDRYLLRADVIQRDLRRIGVPGSTYIKAHRSAAGAKGGVGAEWHALAALRASLRLFAQPVREIADWLKCTAGGASSVPRLTSGPLIQTPATLGWGPLRRGGFRAQKERRVLSIGEEEAMLPNP